MATIREQLFEFYEGTESTQFTRLNGTVMNRNPRLLATAIDNIIATMTEHGVAINTIISNINSILAVLSAQEDKIKELEDILTAHTSRLTTLEANSSNNGNTNNGNTGGDSGSDTGSSTGSGSGSNIDAIIPPQHVGLPSGDHLVITPVTYPPKTDTNTITTSINSSLSFTSAVQVDSTYSEVKYTWKLINPENNAILMQLVDSTSNVLTINPILAEYNNAILVYTVKATNSEGELEEMQGESVYISISDSEPEEEENDESSGGGGANSDSNSDNSNNSSSTGD